MKSTGRYHHEIHFFMKYILSVPEHSIMSSISYFFAFSYQSSIRFIIHKTIKIDVNQKY